MAEHVTQFESPGHLEGAELDRLSSAFDRFPGEESVRSGELRHAELVFALLRAAKERLPIGQVRRHVCHHDEGIGDCSAAPGEVG